jgi:hypothetical protein
MIFQEPMLALLTNNIRELKANIRERSNRVRTRKALKMVVDAARIEPISTPKFPASREFSREFFEKRASESNSGL